jgi:hypothetical protein
VSLYEALSLLVSAVSTLGTVYIGLRQLRLTAPARVLGPVASGGVLRAGPPSPTASRPIVVTAASLLLYAVAAAQPIVFAFYYGIRYGINPGSTAREFGQEGYIDVLGLGAIALVSALLGVFIARGSRVARRLVLSGSVASAGALVLTCVGTVLASPAADQPSVAGMFELLFFGYVAFVGLAYLVSGGLLLPEPAKAHFRRPS